MTDGAADDLTLRSESAVRDLAGLLTPENVAAGASGDATQALLLRPADVVSIAPDGFPRIKIAGGSVIIPGASSAKGVPSLKACIVGDRVFVLQTGSSPLIFGSRPDPAWIAPTLLNSWVNFGGVQATAGYRKDAFGQVRLKGLIGAGTTTRGTTVLTLPAGYRPLATHIFPAASNDLFGEWELASNGNLMFNVGSASWISLSTVRFLAEQ